MAMTSHIQLAVTNLLGSWEKDATGSYKDSFVKSDGGQRRAEDEKEEVLFLECGEATVLRASAEVGLKTFV